MSAHVQVFGGELLEDWCYLLRPGTAPLLLAQVVAARKSKRNRSWHNSWRVDITPKSTTLSVAYERTLSPVWSEPSQSTPPRRDRCAQIHAAASPVSRLSSLRLAQLLVVGVGPARSGRDLRVGGDAKMVDDLPGGCAVVDDREQPQPTAAAGADHRVDRIRPLEQCRPRDAR